MNSGIDWGLLIYGYGDKDKKVRRHIHKRNCCNRIIKIQLQQLQNGRKSNFGT